MLAVFFFKFVPSLEIQGLEAGTMHSFWAGESLIKELKTPWELTLTKPVPEVVEFCPADWPEN